MKTIRFAENCGCSRFSASTEDCVSTTLGKFVQRNGYKGRPGRDEG
jgi:hypothetical protein